MVIPIEPKPLRLLLHLLSRHPAAVSKQELFQALWPDAQVTEDSLTRAVRVARRALGESGSSPVILRTVRGRGYRIGVAVERCIEASNGPPAGTDAFVGRAALLEELGQVLETACSGRGQLVLLSGEPGIGKTRIAEEFTLRAAARGAEVLWGRAAEQEGGPPLWLWLQVLRVFARTRDPASLLAELGPDAAEVASFVPEVHEQLPKLPPPPRLAPEERQFRRFDAVTQLLVRASRQRPLLIVLEDIHSADSSSLELLAFVANGLREAHAVVLASYRSVAPAPSAALERTLAALARSPLASASHLLEGFSVEEAARYLASIRGGGVSSEFARDLRERTGGNPLFLRELAVYAGAEQQCPAGITPGLRAIIGRRVEDLSGQARALVTAAATVGREAPLALLAGALEVSDSGIRDALDEARDAGLLEETQTGSVRFLHAVMSETVYELMSRSERSRLHRLVAETLERVREGAIADRDSALAFHFARAHPRDDEKIAEYAERAGHQAMQRLAFEEAREFYEQALAALDAVAVPDGRARCRLLIDLGEAEAAVGDPARAAGRWREAIAIARETGAIELLARAVLDLSENLVGGLGRTVPERRGALEEVLAALGPNERPLRAHILAALAREYLWSDDREACDRFSREALELARAADDVPALARAIDARHRLKLGAQDPTEARSLSYELLQLARRENDPTLEFEGQLMRICHAIDACDSDEIDGRLQRAGALARELRRPVCRGMVDHTRAARHLWRGEFDAAERLILRAAELAQSTREDMFVQRAAAELFVLRWHRGGLAQLAPALQAGVEKHPAIQTWRCGLALLLAEAGELEEARPHYERFAAHDFANLRRDVSFASNLALLSEVCVALGDRAGAASLHALLLPWQRRFVVVGNFVAVGPGCHYRGLLGTLLGRFDEALGHFERALRIEARMSARPWEAQSRYRLARLLLERGAYGDLEQAREECRTAREIASALGMRPLAARVAALA